MIKIKKILALTLTCFSFAAIGISACGSEEDYGEEVSAEQWAEAWSVEKMLNVTCEYTLATNYTNTEDSSYSKSGSSTDSSAQESYSEDGGEISYGTTVSVIVTDMIIKTAFTDCDGFIEGSAYFNGYFNETQTTAGQTTDTSHRQICYELFTANGYSSVASSDYGDKLSWSGEAEDASGTVENSFVLTYLCGGYSQIAESYSEFEYSDGVYKYTYMYTDYDGSEVTNITAIKIKNGCLNTITISSQVEDDIAIREMKFSDYGKTAVDIPENYTYETFQNNYASIS